MTHDSIRNGVTSMFAAFNVTTGEVIASPHRGRTVAELEDDIHAWIDDSNQNPKPFTWTETADDILANYLAGTSRNGGEGQGVRS